MNHQYATLKEKIAAGKAERTHRNAHFANVWKGAQAVGYMAGCDAQPTPMIVGEATSILSKEIDYSKPTYYVPDGPCGFAWVIVKPGNCAFANWLRKNDIGHKRYYGGWEVSIREHGQSIERKERHAAAMAEYLRKHLDRSDYGSIFSDSRMD